MIPCLPTPFPSPLLSVFAGVTALVPVMDCTTLPPWELSANCYNNLLSAGANCYYEMNVMIEFFNETGILETATTAVKTGDADEGEAAADASWVQRKDVFHWNPPSLPPSLSCSLSSFSMTLSDTLPAPLSPPLSHTNTHRYLEELANGG